MNRKIIFLLILSILHLNFLYAEEKAEKKIVTAIPAKKEKVVIFYFQDKSQEDKYGYLSSIIPVSIAADINRIGAYQAETFPAKMDYLEEKSSEEDRKAFISNLTEKNKEIKSDFLLIGSYIVVEGRINILSQIFDAQRQKIIPVEGTENKVTAIFTEMIEAHTNNINTELVEASKKKKEEEEEKKARTSPFLGFYNFLSGITFGINYGSVNLYKEWGDDFKNSDQVSLYLNYEFNKIALTGNYNYFSTKTNDSNSKGMHYLEIKSGALSLSYLFRFVPNFSLGISAGGGLAKVEVYKEAEKDAMGNIIAPGGVVKETYDPLYTFAASLNFYIGSLKIESGFSYNIVQFSPKQINYSVVYFGLGYRI